MCRYTKINFKFNAIVGYNNAPARPIMLTSSYIILAQVLELEHWHR